MVADFNGPRLDAPDRSGVSGLSPRQVRDRLAEHGWGGIPVMAHDAGSKAAGKAPTIKTWQRFAEFDAELPTADDRRRWEREGPGTGIPCGNVIGIDIDVRDPALVAEIAAIATDVFGETPFIRQGSAPKTMLVYRAAEPIKKRAFKVHDGSGDGLDIMGAGSHFVGFGIHPRTGRHYAWFNAETPLTASPGAAPSITAGQVEVFLDRVRAVLELSKTGGRPRGPGGESAEIARDAEGFAVDGRELWLARCVWRAATELHLAGESLSESAVVDRAWFEFERTARLEINGRRWTKDDCAAKVRGTLDRIRRKAAKLPPLPIAVEPTYPDDALPLAEAEAEVSRLVNDFFEREAPTFKGAQTLYEIKHATNPLVLPPEVRAIALRIEAGIGKTEAAIRAIAAALRRGLSVAYAVPTVELGDAVAARFASIGVVARVWRGREQPDPDAQGETMCRDLKAVADARRAGAFSVTGAVCSRKVRGGEPRRCPFYDGCGHVRQKQAEPTLWIVTHGMLFNKRTASISRPDAIVIDESVYGKAIPDKAATFTVDAIDRAGLPADFKEARTLQRARGALVDALRRAPEGPISRSDLESAGVAAEMARDAKAAEWRRYVEPDIVPGLAPQEREGRVDAVAAVNGEVKSLAGLWTEVADFLDGDGATSGRLTVGQDKNGACVVRRRSLKTMHESWRCPTLALDATAPPADVLAIALGMPVEMRASIRARWNDAGRVRQIVGAPVSSNALGANGQGGGARSLADLARYVAIRAVRVYPAKVGVVIQKDLVARFEALGLPANVDVRHFGALAGLDHWRAYGGVILVGRTAPPPGSMEADAGVLTGEPAVLSSEPFASGGILLRDGSAVAVPVIRLADPMAEALRWQVCEGNLVQALGRIRPLRLGMRQAFFVDVVSDVPLPIVVDEVSRWEEVRPAGWAAMAAGGVIYTSVADLMVARPDLAPTEKAARCLLEESPTSALTSNSDSPLEVRADRTLSSKRVVTIRIRRRGREATEVVILPNGPRGRPEQRRHLERALGPLDKFAIEGEVRPFATIAAEVTARLAWRHPLPTSADGMTAHRLADLGFDASMLAAILESADAGATRDELLRIPSRPSAEARDASLKRLSDAGVICEKTVRGRSRPSTRYFTLQND